MKILNDMNGKMDGRVQHTFTEVAIISMIIEKYCKERYGNSPNKEESKVEYLRKKYNAMFEGMKND